jgi:hypothetical protein
MRNIWLSMTTALVFFVAMAVAQTPSTQDQSQGTTGSSPASTAGAQGSNPEGTNSPSNMNSQTGTGQGYGQQQSGQGQGTASQQPNPGQAGYGQPGSNEGTKAEKKLKGCVESEGGQYMLKTKSGKSIPLTGQDVSAQSGHEVVVHGSWTTAKNEASETSGMAKGGHAFNVDTVNQIADTCTAAGQGKSGSSMQQPQ